MRKFIKQQEVKSIPIPDFSHDIHGLLSKMTSICISGSLQALPSSVAAYFHLTHLKTIPLTTLPNFEYHGEIDMKLLPPITEHVLTLSQAENLNNLFSELYPNSTLSPLLHLCRCSARVCVARETIGS